MNRITIKDLNAVCANLNRLTKSPLEYAKPFKAGVPFCSNIGNYHISQAYGGYKFAPCSQHGRCCIRAAFKWSYTSA